MPDIIQTIGAVLGLLAFLGLALLALLFFSQVRDVRRLRDWAGRAPERAAAAVEQAQAGYTPPPRRAEEEAPVGSGVLGPALAGVGVVVLLVGGYMGFTQFTGSEGEAGTATVAESDGGDGESADVVPNEVSVAVLNGTEIPGLAAQVGTTVEENGFRLGPVTNTREPFEFSVVMYVRGRKAQAEFVAQRFDYSRVRLVSSDIEPDMGPADVAIVVGRDQAQDLGATAGMVVE